ncbi:MAG: hypothetical protein H8D22_10680, partial [Candidatus Cloacimonetes bacterium]|nr:hypothetical protein [Candidatus Cloacimonadota bacterium]
WTEIKDTHTINLLAIEPIDCTIQLVGLVSGDNAEEEASGLWSVMVSLDNVYFEHARGTDDAASGVYTFDDIPDRGSVLFSQREFYNTITLANNKTVRYDPSGCGGHEIKWDCEAKFTATPMTLWANLQILKRWQDRGNLLVFHPGGDYTVDTSPYIQHIISRGETVPPVIYGYMELIPDPHDHWDLLNRISFTFKFYEV